MRRERSRADRRLVHCWITEHGLELLAAMDAAVDRIDDEIVDVLSEDEMRTLVALLDRVRVAGE